MLEPTTGEKNRVIVFIEGIVPTEAERALAEKHGTGVFITTQVPVRVIPHRLAVAVKGVKIPEGYTTELTAPASAPAVPKANPTAPRAGALPSIGSLGVRPPEGA